MRRVAITGGIAEGKSTVLNMISRFGGKTLSSDDVAREVFSSEGVQEQLASWMKTESPVDPTSVRLALAGDKVLRRRLNALMHPRIYTRIFDSSANFIEVPLLLETCLQSSFDAVWVVTCGTEIQLERLTDRVGDQVQAKQLIQLQLPSDVKSAFADLIIRTDRPLEAVEKLVHHAVERELG